LYPILCVLQVVLKSSLFVTQLHWFHFQLCCFCHCCWPSAGSWSEEHEED